MEIQFDDVTYPRNDLFSGLKQCLRVASCIAKGQDVTCGDVALLSDYLNNAGWGMPSQSKYFPLNGFAMYLEGLLRRAADGRDIARLEKSLLQQALHEWNRIETGEVKREDALSIGSTLAAVCANIDARGRYSISVEDWFVERSFVYHVCFGYMVLIYGPEFIPISRMVGGADAAWQKKALGLIQEASRVCARVRNGATSCKFALRAVETFCQQNCATDWQQAQGEIFCAMMALVDVKPTYVLLGQNLSELI